ncbi:SMI1/KNR4 family protein [Stieleria varia]|uniref:Uncharacterized protein n=1 Tax=Stieleria varia TaxID=2528005 RepID=A0A5C6B4E3_9BACT|nr:SMI1/KNR4 family protein [Stieleria varia]TWU06432.1 hypothetical protein Pla52n_21530 [Stieleria varia]
MSRSVCALTEAPPADRPTSDAGARWSQRFEDRYRCSLPEDLADWFDSPWWQTQDENDESTKRENRAIEYAWPVSMPELLSDAPGAIWPALMPCDFVPLLGNGIGDWLCLRFNAHNQVSEIVQWFHGGGDWIPWGKSLSEAILFDAVVNDLPGVQRRHAIEAESYQRGQSATDPVVQWALSHQPPAIAQVFANGMRESESIVDTLLQHGVCEVAVRCQQVVSLLHDPLSETLTSGVTKSLDISEADRTRWVFDTHQIPEPILIQLEQATGQRVLPSQNWQQVQEHCERVTQIAPHLAWAWDLLGYCHQRVHQSEAARAAYRQGIECSIFTDQSVRLRTHGHTSDGVKFSASQLSALLQDGSLVREPKASEEESLAESQYLNLLCAVPADRRRLATTEFWKQRSVEAENQGDLTAASDHAYRAGWDLGAEPITAYPELLQRVARISEAAGQHAISIASQTHRDCFRRRYRV